MQSIEEVSDLIKAIEIDHLLTEITSQLVAIESHRDAPQHELGVALKIQEIFSGWGFGAELVYPLKDRPNVYCRLPGSGRGPILMLNGHLDTVPDYGMAFPAFKPFTQGGNLYGRGTVDMKGALTCMMVAMKLLKELDIPLSGDVLFTGVINEEDRSEGTEYLVTHGPRADRCVVGEPTSSEIMVGHRGLEWLRFDFIGKAAHGGTPEKGINAISMAAKFIAEVERSLMPALSQRVHPIIGPAVMNLGVIKGGVQPSTVADHCALEIDRRWIPQENLQSVLGEYQHILDKLGNTVPGFNGQMKRIETNMATLDHYPMEIAIDDPLVMSLQQAISHLQGSSSPYKAFGGWTDASLISNFGHTPSVIFGPGELALAHSPNEHVSIADLVFCTRVYSLLAFLFCNSHSSFKKGKEK